MLNKPELTRLVRMCFAPWPHVIPDEYLFAAYEVALSDYSATECLEAVTNCLREPERQFPPTPPNIINNIKNTIRRIAIEQSDQKRIETQRHNSESAVSRKRREEIIAATYTKLTPEVRTLLDIIIKPTNE